MATAPKGGESGQGVTRTYKVYEGDATRTDVETTHGTEVKGVVYAAGISNDLVKQGIAYVKRYTTWEKAVQRVATGENGEDIIGRVKAIDTNTPDISTNGGTWTAAYAGARNASVEEFQKGQIILVRARGDVTPIAIGNKLSLVTGSLYLFNQDNTNGRFYAMQATTDADAWIQVEVIS